MNNNDVTGARSPPIKSFKRKTKYMHVNPSLAIARFGYR